MKRLLFWDIEAHLEVVIAHLKDMVAHFEHVVAHLGDMLATLADVMTFLGAVVARYSTVAHQTVVQQFWVGTVGS
jgi:hypothetical protein